MVAKKKTGRVRTAKSGARRAGATRPSARKRRWSQRVTETSDALDLEQGVFTQRSSRATAHR